MGISVLPFLTRIARQHCSLQMKKSWLAETARNWNLSLGSLARASDACLFHLDGTCFECLCNCPVAVVGVLSSKTQHDVLTDTVLTVSKPQYFTFCFCSFDPFPCS